MDGMSLSNVGILIHDESQWSLVGGNNTSASDNGDVGDFMVVDATNVHKALRVVGVKDAHIISSNGAIGTTVNEGARAVDTALADIVRDVLVDGVRVMVDVFNSIISNVRINLIGVIKPGWGFHVVNHQLDDPFRIWWNTVPWK